MVPSSSSLTGLPVRHVERTEACLAFLWPDAPSKQVGGGFNGDAQDLVTDTIWCIVTPGPWFADRRPAASYHQREQRSGALGAPYAGTRRARDSKLQQGTPAERRSRRGCRLVLPSVARQTVLEPA